MHLDIKQARCSLGFAVGLMNRSGLVKGRVPVEHSRCRRRTVTPWRSQLQVGASDGRIPVGSGGGNEDRRSHVIELRPSIRTWQRHRRRVQESVETRNNWPEEHEEVLFYVQIWTSPGVQCARMARARKCAAAAAVAVQAATTEPSGVRTGDFHWKAVTQASSQEEKFCLR
jgi:hypothetical protein